MPPKSVPTARMGRAYRLTARKRIPNYSKTVRVHTRSSSPAAATAADDSGSENRLPFTDVPASSECSKDNELVRSPGTMDVPETITHSLASISQTETGALLETLAADSELDKPETDSVTGEKFGSSFEPENSRVECLGADERLAVEDAISSRTDGGSKDVVNLASAPVLGLHVAEECSVRAAGTGNGKRKVVRKTVRIVKRVIKKRVPKRSLASDSKDQGLVEKDKDGLNSSNQTQSSNLTNDVDEMAGNVSVVDEGKGRSDTVNATECLNLVNDANVVEKSSEVVEESKIVGEGTRELIFDRETSFLEPIVREVVQDHPSGIGCMEAEMSQFQFGVSLLEHMVDNRSDDPSSVHDMDANIQSNEVKNSIQVGNVNYAAETVTNTKEREDSALENEAKVSAAGTLSMNIVGKDYTRSIACQNVGAEGENVEDLVVEKNERNIEKAGGGNDEMESAIIRTNELLLSGEMEALERRKRRKTEIFIGGLDKNTNEDEIRKVFNEVGDILDVRLAMKGQTKKNKGFAFVRFATAAAAKKALEDYSRVEIRGKQCGVVPVEGKDTIFLGNIEKTWRTDNVLRLLETAGIEKIDKVTLKADPKNIEKNRGFAFVEFETCRDAQIAFHKLQKKDVFGRNPTVRVEWAQPLAEPDEQEILKVKSVYAEFLPSAWDEEKVREYFKRFGEIKNVVLAKDRLSSRRKDFAFITYTTRDAAITCIEAINREQLEDGSKVKIVVSLAKPIPKSKQVKHNSDLSSKQPFNAKPRGLPTSKRPHEPREKGMPSRSRHYNVKVDSEPSTTDELVQLLRQQASSNRIPLHPRTGPSVPHYDSPSPGSKRPYLLITHDQNYSEPQLRPHMHVESSYPISGPSSSSYGVSWSSFTYRPERPGFTHESVHERRLYPDFQTTQEAPYHGNGNRYWRY